MGGTVTQRRRQLLDAPTTGPARRLLQAVSSYRQADDLCLAVSLAGKVKELPPQVLPGDRSKQISESAPDRGEDGRESEHGRWVREGTWKNGEGSGWKEIEPGHQKDPFKDWTARIATDPCNAGAMICLDIQLALPYSDAFNANEDGREGLVSSFHAQMESNQQMKDSLHGFGQCESAVARRIGWLWEVGCPYNVGKPSWLWARVLSRRNNSIHIIVEAVSHHGSEQPSQQFASVLRTVRLQGKKRRPQALHKQSGLGRFRLQYGGSPFAIFATRFKISQPDWQDQQPSDVPGRQLTQGDSTPPDCSGLDATLPRRLRDELISDPECERELVQLPDDGTPPGPDPGESNPPGDEGGDVITDQPEDEDPSSGSSDGNLGMILGLALGLGLGITALVGVLYLVVRARRLKEKTVLAAAQRVVNNEPPAGQNNGKPDAGDNVTQILHLLVLGTPAVAAATGFWA
eukprot:1142862-Pelagomonas_calceolata.AAC.2